MNLPPVTILRKKREVDPKQKYSSVYVFIKEHADKGHSGVATAAWYGLQWDGCGDFINVQCSECGDTLVQRTRNSEIEIMHSDVLPNSKRKIS
jgi:hypothetical protein